MGYCLSKLGKDRLQACRIYFVFYYNPKNHQPAPDAKDKLRIKELRAQECSLNTRNKQSSQSSHTEIPAWLHQAFFFISAV